LPEPYELKVAGPAVRALARIPDRIGLALVEFMTERLVENPHRIGKPLMGKFAGLYAARVRDYRIRYRIEESTRTVVVLHVAQRADAYRPE
jgi:mRNA interferase RelE/StbE